MTDLHGLYQEVILDHNKRPHNFRAMPEASHHADGFNRLCGDRVTIFLKIDGDKIGDVSFQGSGCAISTASASILTDAVKGKTRAEAESLFQTFHDLVTGHERGNGKKPQAPQLGKLAVFSGVSEFPARVKCASLAWHTLHNALQGSEEVVSTETEEQVPGEIR
ncbi:MAG TPA: SUF system NifU family Fe-S cluster assembly protein [Terriglobia bacterium]|nr:SUF system NifU family Fe-S cluster assembly protein [Terriglobia bacterium]